MNNSNFYVRVNGMGCHGCSILALDHPRRDEYDKKQKDLEKEREQQRVKESFDKYRKFTPDPFAQV